MKTFLASKLLILLFLLVQILHAELEFDHKDWQVVCDNTHTCRMAGYTLMTLDGKHIPLSMMFVRQAGADQGFDGFIKIGLWDGQKEIPENKVTISVGGQRYTTSKDAKMSDKLTKALLQALIKDQKILVNLGKNITWKMSQSGTFAVMLKMDEYQKRIGTKGALFKKGNKNENEVLEQKVLPTIAAPSWPLSQNFPQEVTLEDDVKKKDWKETGRLLWR